MGNDLLSGHRTLLDAEVRRAFRFPGGQVE
jgi:hypothetical protein